MKESSKLLMSSIITLTFASPQAIYGMEDLSKPGGQGLKKPYDLAVSGGSDIIEESPKKKRKNKEILENLFEPEKCPIEVRFNILERTAIDNYLSYGNTGNLGGVCKDWLCIIEQEEMKKSIELIKWDSIIIKSLELTNNLMRVDLTCGDLLKILAALDVYYKEVCTLTNTLLPHINTARHMEIIQNVSHYDSDRTIGSIQIGPRNRYANPLAYMSHITQLLVANVVESMKHYKTLQGNNHPRWNEFSGESQ